MPAHVVGFSCSSVSRVTLAFSFAAYMLQSTHRQPVYTLHRQARAGHQFYDLDRPRQLATQVCKSCEFTPVRTNASKLTSDKHLSWRTASHSHAGDPVHPVRDRTLAVRRALVGKAQSLDQAIRRGVGVLHGRSRGRKGSERLRRLCQGAYAACRIMFSADFRFVQTWGLTYRCPGLRAAACAEEGFARFSLCEASRRRRLVSRQAEAAAETRSRNCASCRQLSGSLD